MTPSGKVVALTIDEAARDHGRVLDAASGAGGGLTVPSLRAADLRFRAATGLVMLLMMCEPARSERKSSRIAGSRRAAPASPSGELVAARQARPQPIMPRAGRSARQSERPAPAAAQAGSSGAGKKLPNRALAPGHAQLRSEARRATLTPQPGHPSGVDGRFQSCSWSWFASPLWVCEWVCVASPPAAP
jgi:hypothetical protein